MKNSIKLAVFLAIVCIICAAVLSSLNNVTEPIIAKNEKDKVEAMLKEMVPQANKFEEVKVEKNRDLTDLYIAYEGDKKIASVLQVYASGFQSDIKLLVVVTPEDKFDGFKVIEQAETPGYGDVIELNNQYISQFKKKSINDEIDTVSGSTVTTGAVKKAIEAALEKYKAID